MNLLFLDRKFSMCEAWRAAFEGTPGVAVEQCSFEDAIGQFDCLVSPANSFGLMDGGMDAAIIGYFGSRLEDRVRLEIWKQYRGQQPVGTCLMVPTGHSGCPWLAHCPTMVVPDDVRGTDHAYSAALAAFTTAEAAGINTLACPGLATGVGKIPSDIAATQMRFAYDMWRAPFTPFFWPEAYERVWKSTGLSRRDFVLQQFGNRRLDDN